MLALHCTARRMSRIYETRPLYVEDQPAFLNAVGQALSFLPPAAMLDMLHKIEQARGRNRPRERRMGPRTLDMDILLCGDLVMETPDLTIPHPRIAERAFVLVPLLELEPGIMDPRSGQPFARALELLDRRGGGAEARGVYLSPDG